MATRRLPLALLAGLMLAATPPAAARTATAAADPIMAVLSYSVYFGGAEIAGMDIDIDLDSGAYDVKVTLRTVGLIGRIFPWQMKAHSEGAMTRDDVSPRRAGQRSNWRGKKRRVELAYRDGKLARTTVEPEPEEDDRNPVPASMRRDTLDVASAILRIVLTMDRGAKCTGRVPVFDGRRRYDMVLAHKVTETLTATRYSPFKGAADNCKVTMDRIGGFKREFERARREEVENHAEGLSGHWKTRRSASVWIGRIFDRVPPMPVRLAFDTRFGAVRAHLVGAKIDAAGITRRLALRR